MTFSSFTDNNDDFVNDLNPGEFTAAVIGAGAVVASVGVTTAVAPQFVVPPALVAAGAWVMGYNKRFGHLPLMGKRDQAVAPATPAPVAAPQPVAVAPVPPITDRAGQELNPEYI